MYLQEGVERAQEEQARDWYVPSQPDAAFFLQLQLHVQQHRAKALHIQETL
jgi:hypothetical protein